MKIEDEEYRRTAAIVRQCIEAAPQLEAQVALARRTRLSVMEAIRPYALEMTGLTAAHMLMDCAVQIVREVGNAEGEP
jgi:hypothetical protein